MASLMRAEGGIVGNALIAAPTEAQISTLARQSAQSPRWRCAAACSSALISRSRPAESRGRIASQASTGGCRSSVSRRTESAYSAEQDGQIVKCWRARRSSCGESSLSRRAESSSADTWTIPICLLGRVKGLRCRVLVPECSPGPRQAAAHSRDAAVLDVGDLFVRIAFKRVQQEGGRLLGGKRRQDPPYLIALRDGSVIVRHHRILTGPGEATDAQPGEAALPAQMVDRGIGSDAIEPWQDFVLCRERPERLIGLGEDILAEIVGADGIG